ncbi:MAG TPA: class I SAM-dependent methyltransferase [Anaerolineae bacterium]|jgi:ubiquinone/menaquinone biosynthesis C-methylase UbiE|nr:class I SAM-dependent methyltransferase [Anaerolineae bacterium]
MAAVNERDIKRSQAIYTKPFLAAYDLLVLGYNCRFVWKCPASLILDLYNKHVSANHLDIGVGSGYFLDHCTFPVTTPRIALMDLNQNSLDKTKERIKRYNPEVYRVNVLELDGVEIQKFDSIGITNLLHCLPGTMQTKGVVFKGIKNLLNPGGVIFGSTILYKGVKNSLQAKYSMMVGNLQGAFCNKQDDLNGLKQNLEQHFSESSVKTVGSMALFWAKK